MSDPVLCRGCGRRLALPATINRAKARCPKCRTRVESPATADPKTPDAYHLFSESQPLPKLTPPPRESISLDDAEAIKPRPALPPSQYPPPFRTPVHVLSDNLKQFHGPMDAVLTPHGLFLEAELCRPLLFVPVGARSAVTGCDLDIALPGRRIDLRFTGTSNPDQLAADAASFLAGERPVPLPAEYRPPWWLAGVGVIFATGLASAPVLLAAVSGLIAFGPALALAVVFGALASLANAGIAILTRLPTAAKIGAMAVLNGTALALFLAGAIIYARDHQPPPAPLAPVQPPHEEPPAPPPQPPEPPPPPETPPPVTHIDFIQKSGRAKFEPGPADVTAIASLPGGGILVAHADGSSRIWNLDQPAFEPPTLGPRTPSPLRRITFEQGGKLAVMACDTGLVLAPFGVGQKPTVIIPGESGTLIWEKNRDRFAILRNGRVHIRYTPLELLKDPPANRVKNGFINTIPQDETLPLGVPPAGLIPPGGKPTFLAWHPGGRLLAGRPDGTIASLAIGGGTPFASNEHKAAVRAWELTPNADFISGDAEGFIGWWPNKTTKITKFRASESGIASMAFNVNGGELAVADVKGRVSLWMLESGEKLGDVKGTASVVAFAPRAGVLLLGSGKGVEAVWVPDLAPRFRLGEP